MPLLNEHNEACRKLLGYSIPEVHRMLDNPRPNVHGNFINHRLFYHNKEFIEKFIRPKYGRKGVMVAFIHLMQDVDIINLNDLKFMDDTIWMKRMTGRSGKNATKKHIKSKRRK